jgi:hypothetical protein
VPRSSTQPLPLRLPLPSPPPPLLWKPSCGIQLPVQSNGPHTASAAVTVFIISGGETVAPPSLVSSAHVSHEACSPVPEQVGPQPEVLCGGVQFWLRTSNPDRLPVAAVG